MYWIRRYPMGFMATCSFIIFIVIPILVFIYFHQQDIIDNCIYGFEKLRNFIMPQEVVIEKIQSIEEKPKADNKSFISKKTIIIGIGITTVVVVTGATIGFGPVLGVGISLFFSQNGGWGGS